MNIQHYPRHVLCRDGALRVVDSRQQHQVHVDYKVGPDGSEMTAEAYLLEQEQLRIDSEKLAAANELANIQARITEAEALKAAQAHPGDSAAENSARFMKLYACGCKAGPGPANMPDYCPDHGKLGDTAETIPYEETGTELPIAETEEPVAEPKPPVEDIDVF